MKKKKLIFASWPYLHTMPGIHNMIPVLAADVYSRYQRLQNNDVIFIVGTDEYGSRTELIAKRKNIAPKDLLDNNYNVFSNLLLNWLKVSVSWLPRTTDKAHYDFVQDFYLKLSKSNLLFEKDIQIYYCNNCNIFLPDRLIKGMCPKCKKGNIIGNQCKYCGHIFEQIDILNPSCSICGAIPIKKNSKHWFLNIDKNKVAISKYHNSKKNWSPLVKSYTKESLSDINFFNITRDLNWGIKVPFVGYENKTIFCWADSILGNVSTLKCNGIEHYMYDSNAESTYFMGKDNIPFYSILLPSLFIASKKYILPDNIVAHNFLTFLGKPCSKSDGNGIWLNEAKIILDNPDCWRYYLIKNIPFENDINFEWKNFVETINKDLVNTISLFIWKVAKHSESITGSKNYSIELYNILKGKIINSTISIKENIESFKITFALAEIISLSEFFLNQLTSSEENRLLQNNICLYQYACKNLAILLNLFLPSTSKRIWSILKFHGTLENQTWELIGLNFSHQDCQSKISPKHIFESIDEEYLKKQFRKLKRDEQEILERLGEYCERWNEQ